MMPNYSKCGCRLQARRIGAASEEFAQDRGMHCMYQNIPPSRGRRKWSFAGRHDPRHSLTESLSVYGRPSNWQRDARRRHIQEQERQGATHLEMQGEAQEGRNYGHGRLAGAKSERKKGRADMGECNR